MNFCMTVDIHDVITWVNFGDDRLRGLGVAGGQILAFPIDFDRRPYNTLALPCECVIIATIIITSMHHKQNWSSCSGACLVVVELPSLFCYFLGNACMKLLRGLFLLPSNRQRLSFDCLEVRRGK